MTQLDGVCFVEDGRLRYRAIAGDVYDAVQLGSPNLDGTLTIHVYFPGVRKPVFLSRIKLEREVHEEKKCGGCAKAD